MSEAKVSIIAKPQLRGLLNSAIKKHLSIAIVFSLTTAVLWKTVVADPRRKKYADFYRDYDAEKEFEIMKSKGVFQSCQ
ncbi:cytochrome c oxidase subunit 6C-like [Arctopsyche grandis]|uniref:cytochrome c oxidase subunit 6C-like n=1 Tax=Arctopsyche grandis TaxID=121162 RepID=UPI00406D6F2B